MTGLIIQPGAFNPIHRMHLKIAIDAIKRFPDHFHGFLLSSKTCDKGDIPKDELERRRNIIKEKGYNCFITESGLFIDHIKSIRDSEQYNMKTSLEIVIACGEDTIYRFFRDWDKYYNEKYPDQYLKRFEDYEKVFANVTWYVAHRSCPERHQFTERLLAYQDKYDNIIWSDLDLDDISSTKLRSGEVIDE